MCRVPALIWYDDLCFLPCYKHHLAPILELHVGVKHVHTMAYYGDFGNLRHGVLLCASSVPGDRSHANRTRMMVGDSQSPLMYSIAIGWKI
jgi:hypothetical protein